ncbi:MAG: GAF domain-containing protein [Bacteroidales bacterium]|nr:GAF domain-containing protein [Bacteroidales bacterium]
MPSKTEKYGRICLQLEQLLVKSNDPLARMASINAILYHKMQNFFWVGFYLLNQDRLIVGPYQGPVACMELAKNKGVCWHSVNTQETVIVPNVNKFPGHIACDSRSKSEIAVPLFNAKGQIAGVMDIDSNKPDFFDRTDADFLEKIVKLIY